MLKGSYVKKSGEESTGSRKIGVLTWRAKSCLHAYLVGKGLPPQVLKNSNESSWGTLHAGIDSEVTGKHDLRRMKFGEKTRNKLREVITRGMLEQCDVLGVGGQCSMWAGKQILDQQMWTEVSGA